MRAALEKTVVLGVVTNLARLRAIVEHPAFARGDLHTGFVDEHLRELSPAACPPDEAMAAAAAALHVAARRAPAGPARAPEPWERLGPWRLGG
jgi:3-methylcrotonyl-CoA carboxylase alpha subunit